jgi:hypothetical protein
MQAATEDDLGAFERGFVAAHTHSDSAAAHRRSEARAGVLVILAAAVPLALSIFVVWWLGVLVFLVAGGALWIWFSGQDDADLEPGVLVYQFEQGLVFPTEDGAETVRWDDVTSVYATVTRTYFSGTYSHTEHSHHLVTARGRHVWLSGNDNEETGEGHTDIAELAQVVQDETMRRHLAAATAVLNAGGQVSFGDVTLGPDTITTPAGTAPWSRVKDLSARSGTLSLRVKGRRRWKRPVNRIPNFSVFWILAGELVTAARQHQA